MFNWLFKKKEPDTWVGTVSLGWYEVLGGPTTKITYLQLFESANGDRYVEYSLAKDSVGWYQYPYKSHNIFNKHVWPWLYDTGIDKKIFYSYNDEYFKDEEPVKVTQEENVFFINKDKKQ